MKYINKEDLLVDIQEPILNESICGSNGNTDDSILDKIEISTIDLVISCISGRYKTDDIFNTPIRNGVLVQIICAIVICRAISRNARRKVPDDNQTKYDKAIKALEKIQAGTMTLENCPIITAADGTTSGLVYGNNTKDEFFI
jgi:phage gp36-like protein